MEEFVNKYLTDYKNKNITVLDIGSQDVNGTYKPLFDYKGWNYLGVDMENGKNVNIVLKDIYNWREIKSSSVDVVISGQAFEHIEYFWVTMLEITRVLKTGGLCCIIAPSGGFEHKYPLDCWRFFPDGFKAMGEYAGLIVIEVYTEWNPVEYDDGSQVWKDSVLICKKPYMSDLKRIRFYMKNFLSRFILKL